MMRIENASTPLDRARRDARQAVADVEAGGGLSIVRMFVLMARLKLGSLWLWLVWKAGL